MPEPKTSRNDGDVDAFIASVDEARRDDVEEIRRMMEEATGEPGAMWGTAIVGFSDKRMVYANGREGTWFEVGFSPRKQNLTLYIMSGFDGYDELLSRLGRHKTGKACLYIKRLDDIDRDVLVELIEASVRHPDG